MHLTNMPTEISTGRSREPGIARLNQQYGSLAGAHFMLLHRRRVWSDTQQQWIGWERKRQAPRVEPAAAGATDDLPRHRRHASAVPTGVRYVITSTPIRGLPRDTARRLIGKLAHPLNEPRFDADSGAW
jgi:cyclic beta-1,2-glucan synthetase